MSANEFLSGKFLPSLTHFEYINKGTFSRVWSVPFQVGSLPSSAVIITKSSSFMSALVRMATLMRKGNEELKTGKTDYSDEVKDINKMLKDSDKK